MGPDVRGPRQTKGWVMRVRVSVSNLLLGKRVLRSEESRTQRSVEAEAEADEKYEELLDRVRKVDRVSTDVCSEVETLCSGRSGYGVRGGSPGSDFDDPYGFSLL